MITIESIRDEREAKTSQLSEDCQVFWAFSQSQFEESKPTLAEGDQYAQLYGGGYLPKSKKKDFFDGLEAIHQWFQEQVKTNNLRKELIAFELGNHEAYYIGDIETTMNALGEDYTEAEVWEVYNEERRQNEAQEEEEK